MDNISTFFNRSKLWRASDERTNDYSLEVDKAMIMLKLMKLWGSRAADLEKLANHSNIFSQIFSLYQFSTFVAFWAQSCKMSSRHFGNILHIFSKEKIKHCQKIEESTTTKNSCVVLFHVWLGAQ